MEGLLIAKKYPPESRSAKMSNNRPIFNQILDDIRAGKYDGILAYHPDRLARNMLEAGMIIEKDILARTLLLNIEIDNKKEPVFLWNEPFKTLLESLSVNVGAPD